MSDLYLFPILGGEATHSHSLRLVRFSTRYLHCSRFFERAMESFPILATQPFVHLRALSISERRTRSRATRVNQAERETVPTP